MDDVGFSPNSSFCADVDIDFMDQLLDNGCWLQTAAPSTSDVCDISLLPPQQDANQQDLENFADSAISRVPLEAENSLGFQSDNQIGIQSLDSEAIIPQFDLLVEGCEQNRIWIAPKADAGPSSSVKDRLMMAVRHFQALSRERDLLIQIWVPVTRGVKNFLTTVEQPYSYDPDCAPLVHYRNVSEGYHFCADEDSKEGLGLPGRVFLGKFPEWTPDVRLFRLDEYPRVNYALMCDVRGSVALPVFEIWSGSCVGVVEIITTTQKINYRPEVESVCKALEAVNLRSSEIISPLEKKVETNSYDIELFEILHILKTICENHSLPLGQTWAPCTQHKKGGCWRLEKNNDCISTIDSACYVHDQRVSGFHEACYEQHLFKDQGVVGKAFITNEPCYAADVTEYSKGEYPLSHHAKMFGLSGALALRIGCLHGTRRSYVLEFFLPIDGHDHGHTFHSQVMESLRTQVQACQSLCVLSTEHEGLLGGEEDEIVEPTKEDETCDANEPQKGKGDNEGESSKAKTLHVESSVGDSCSLGTKEKAEKNKTKMQRSISLEVLKQYFSGSLKDAAKSIGVCPTTLKRICRQRGISRWPSRKIKKVDHSLRKLQHVIDTVHGAQGSIQISSFYSNFPELGSPTTGSVKIKDQTDKITTSSSSQTSSSNHLAANKAQKMQVLDNEGKKQDLGLGGECENLVSLRVGQSYKVKATFGEDKIRLKLGPKMGFGDLRREIAARFSKEDVSWMQIRYLDDDNEWVMLTCDDDLEECIDIHRSSGSDMIRLLIQQTTTGLGTSFTGSAKS